MLALSNIIYLTALVPIQACVALIQYLMSLPGVEPLHALLPWAGIRDSRLKKAHPGAAHISAPSNGQKIRWEELFPHHRRVVTFEK